jgi:hypothetical protein
MMDTRDWFQGRLTTKLLGLDDEYEDEDAYEEA